MGFAELPVSPWRQHEPAPPSSSQLHVYLLCQRCPRSLYLAFLTCCGTQKKPWTLIEEIVTAPVLLISCFPRKPCSVASLLWTLNGGARRLHCFFLFFPLPSPQRTMTLKSNKNEPAVTLESVNSVRTALSDLYLEQLIQNKPKSDKVRYLFFLVIFFFTHSFRAPTAIYGLLACFRDSAMRHMTVVCFATRSLKIDLASVFIGKTHCKWTCELKPLGVKDLTS